MISYLKGILVEKKPPELVVEVGGVGYVLTASMNTFYNLPELGSKIFIYTHLIIREDAHLLYGFINERERALFLALIKVNGVGPKLAITILSSIDPDSFVQCIHNNDTANLVRLPGIGKKTAERLVIDMRDRLKDWQLSHDLNTANFTGDILLQQAKQDALSALISLGYKLPEAKRALEKITAENLTSEELIRQGLKNLTR